MDGLFRVHLSPTMAPGTCSVASHTSVGLPTTLTGASAPTNAASVPKSDMRSDGPPLSAGDGLRTTSQSSNNVRHLGSGQATSLHHPLFPADCDFKYNREVAMHSRTGPWLDACPQGRHSADTSRQGSGFAPRSQPQWQLEGEGNVYARSPRSHQPYSGPRDYRNVTAHPDHRRYNADVDAEYGQDDEASLTQGGKIISSTLGLLSRGSVGLS